MMRKCHLNTCPVGIATQNPELRKKFTGKPEHVINYFFLVAEEVRNIMASLGFRKFNDLIGRTDKLNAKKAIKHWKAKGLDFSRLFYRPDVDRKIAFYNCEKQNHPIDDIIDRDLIVIARKVIKDKSKRSVKLGIKNTDRTTGAMLSGFIAKKRGHKGLKDDSIVVKFNGTAGQSFGAFLSKGVTFSLTGDANDYVGKGISGGKIIIKPPKNSSANSEKSMIVGNTVLYGAIGGESYFRGIAGERFCVRNSGVISVIEGVGDHGCEYMTGGIVLCLGKIGRNFAAGMSGGIAYVYNPKGDLKFYLNSEMVETRKIVSEGIKDNDIPKNISKITQNMLSDDEVRIKFLLKNHVFYTDSPKAKDILGKWEKLSGNFVKITPLDFKRALLERENDSFIKSSVG
tara:strand:- start:790 stop:1989 length:1200 start_codon:yes stop_codon:yes gene_type:complete